MGDAKRARVLVEEMRSQCLKKNLGGIKGLSVFFRGMDKDFSQAVSQLEFKNGMKAFGIVLSDQEMDEVFYFFDKDGNGVVDFREFLDELRPPMPLCRKRVVAQAFDHIDVIKDGLLQVDDLKIVYMKHAKKHPKVRSGQWTIDECLEKFIETFDDPNNKDGVITPEEFLNYYSGVSSTIDDDAYFDLMMRSVWGLPQTRKGSENTTTD